MSINHNYQTYINYVLLYGGRVSGGVGGHRSRVMTTALPGASAANALRCTGPSVAFMNQVTAKRY